jgi:ABC-type branched-subunit amino acid transport system ATPase component
MAKNHQTENPLYRALMKRADAEIATALASLIVYFDTPTAGKSLSEMEHLLDIISESEKRIDTLNKHFNNTQI